MIQHTSGDAGFFNHAIAIHQGGDPTQIQLIGLNGTTTEDHPGVGGVIRNGVEHFARALGFRIDVVAASVDQLQRRDHVVRGVVDVEQRAVWPTQRFCQHESQLHFNARHDKAIGRDIAAIVEEHVIQQRAVIRFADLRACLHRFRGQADFVAFQRATFGDFQANPFALHRVSVFDGDLRVIQ
ncbi:hypothetical protein BvCmsKSNP073_01212 [Escherichia coli]|nr:hypothetical protein BvCmsKSNP073_01212 [Escherichia coli]